MSRPGITYDDVASAALQIAAQGKHPTIETIRSIIGTGSNTTIAQHLKIWKNRQEHAKSLFNHNEVPEEIALTVKGLWDRVLNQADEKVTEIKNKLEQTITTLKEQNKKLEEDNSRWQQESHHMKQEKEALATDKTALEQLLKKFEQEKISLSVENDSLKIQLQEKQDRIDELHRLNRQVQANLEHYYEASREQRLHDQQQHEQAQAQLLQTNNQLKQELTLSNQQKNSLQDELNQIHYTKTLLQDQYEQLSVQHETIKSRLNHVQNDLLQRTTAEQQWELHYQKAQEKLDEQRTELVNIQSQLAVSSQQLIDSKGELKEVSEQNKFLTNERWILAQENAQLVGQLKQLEKIGLG